MKPSYDDETLSAYFQPLSPETWSDPIVGPVLRSLADLDPDIIAAVQDIDRSLIRECLRRAPLERLRVAAAHQRALARFRRVG